MSCFQVSSWTQWLLLPNCPRILPHPEIRTLPLLLKIFNEISAIRSDSFCFYKLLRVKMLCIKLEELTGQWILASSFRNLQLFALLHFSELLMQVPSSQSNSSSWHSKKEYNIVGYIIWTFICNKYMWCQGCPKWKNI